MAVVELGGNIVLEGFEGRDFTEMIVVKKMVGQYARKLSDACADLGALRVDLALHGDGASEVVVSLSLKGKELRAQERASNLYIALDAVLKKILAQAQEK